MKAQRFTDQFEALLSSAIVLCGAAPASALLLMLEGPTDWDRLRKFVGDIRLVVVADLDDELEGAEEAGLTTIVLGAKYIGVYEKLSQALLECVARELFDAGASIVALYSGFETGSVDSVSMIRMVEHLGQLTSRDLRQLTGKVPLSTLKLVVDLALEIGREGREGKPVGTLFVVGDTRKVMQHSHPAGFDPVKGYSRKERNLNDPRVREGIKEVAPMDGAFVVAPDATVEAACRYIDADAAEVTLSKGLGARHWAAAAISKVTKALAVTVSESSGTVRIFSQGEVVLRVEPLRRPMKWKPIEVDGSPQDPRD